MVESTATELRKACRRLAEIWRVRFDHRKACGKLQSFGKSIFDHLKACKGVNFHYSEAYSRLA